MAHIHLIHTADDSDAAERVADVLYFLDYDVNLLTRDAPDPQSVSADTSQDVVLVLWTASAQKDRWLTAQCRDIDDPDRLVTIVPKTAGSPALPLMLHRGYIVRLEYQDGRMRLSTLQTLLSEIGRRTGRDGLVSGVAALLRPEEEERVQALSQWVAANPDDTLAPTVQSVLETHSSGEIHNALVEITDGVIGSSSGLRDIAGGVAQRVRLPRRISPILSYAAIGIIAAGAFLATLLPIINQPTESVEFERIELPEPVQMASAEPSGGDGSSPADTNETLVRAPDLDPEAEDITLVAADAGDAPELEAVGDVEAEYVIDPLPDMPADLPPVPEPEDMLDASLAAGTAEPSLGVPDPAESEPEPVVAPQPETPISVPEPEIAEAPAPAPDPAEDETETAGAADPEDPADAAEPAQQAELLLPYIPGTQQPGDAFTDRLSDETGAPIMVVVPQGVFTMGSPLSERGRDISEGPQRSVSIGRAFAVSKYEITIAEFEKFMAATEYDASGACQVYADDVWTAQSGVNFRDTGYLQTPQHPATCIDWNGAVAYAAWLSEETGAPYRLLSEAEWEYAARAGSDQAFPFGADANEGCGFMNGADEDAPPGVLSGLALKCTDGAAYTSRVGTYLPNRFGLYDMHGNAWEWTLDVWHSSYDGAPRSGAPWDFGQSNERVIRGGSWFTYDFWLRSASRKGFAPGERRYDVGFRVARDL